MIALEIGSSAAHKTGTNKIKSILQHLNDTKIANMPTTIDRVALLSFRCHLVTICHLNVLLVSL